MRTLLWLSLASLLVLPVAAFGGPPTPVQGPTQAPSKQVQAPAQAPATQAPTQAPAKTAQADTGYRTYSYQPGYRTYSYEPGYRSYSYQPSMGYADPYNGYSGRGPAYRTGPAAQGFYRADHKITGPY
jgi:hypothetical protein